MTVSAPEPYSVAERAAIPEPDVVCGQRATLGCLSLASALVVLRERVAVRRPTRVGPAAISHDLAGVAAAPAISATVL